MSVGTEARLSDPTLEAGRGEVHITCCRRSNVTLCGYYDDAITGTERADVTCAFCDACEKEDDLAEELGLPICCQIDGRPCPEEYQW